MNSSTRVFREYTVLCVRVLLLFHPDSLREAPQRLSSWFVIEILTHLNMASDMYIRPMFLRGEGELKHKLYIACENGNVKDAKRFIEAGASPQDSIQLFQRGQQKYQCHPLLAAIQQGNVELIDYLIREAGVLAHDQFYTETDGENDEIVQKYNGLALLMYTIDIEENKDLIEFAIAKAKEANALDAQTIYDNLTDEDNEDWQGLSCLQFFARAKNEKACQLLLKHGADPNLSTNTGRTSLNLYPDITNFISQ